MIHHCEYCFTVNIPFQTFPWIRLHVSVYVYQIDYYSLQTFVIVFKVFFTTTVIASLFCENVLACEQSTITCQFRINIIIVYSNTIYEITHELVHSIYIYI